MIVFHFAEERGTSSALVLFQLSVVFSFILCRTERNLANTKVDILFNS